MTREDIIATAFRVWGRDLYRTISLTEVARELKVSKPALYRHFKDKEALLDAMHASYFDHFSGFMKDGYDRALSAKDKQESVLVMMRTIAEYYVRNRDAFIFSLVRVYGSRDRESLGMEFRSRGIDMRRLYHGETDNSYPSRFQLIVVTLIYCTARFHTGNNEKDYTPTDEQVTQYVAEIEKRVLHGLELDAKKVAAIDYSELEKQSAAIIYYEKKDNAPDNILLEAVAGAVAEAGPWNASMEMVAKRSGLSKSGLYAHFKNKQDMLGKFFITEISRIVKLAGAQIETAKGSEEQVYLAVLTMINYLRARPEILASLDWLKARRLELGRSFSERLSGIIKTIKIKAIQNQDQYSLVWIAQWILFMIVNTLAWWSEELWTCSPGKDKDWAKKIAEIPDESFRLLFRYIALGLEGLNR